MKYNSEKDKDISKRCADALREAFKTDNPGLKLKASHARELVAAYFGCKSHAALIYSEIKEFAIPDVSLIDLRKTQLHELPKEVKSGQEIEAFLNSVINKITGINRN